PLFRSPLVPRPAVLPFDASPRPTRVFDVFAPFDGRRSCSLMISAMVYLLPCHFFDGDQVTYLIGHTTDDRGPLRTTRMSDALEAQSLPVCAVVWHGAYQALYLCNLQSNWIMPPVLRAGAAYGLGCPLPRTCHDVRQPLQGGPAASGRPRLRGRR